MDVNRNGFMYVLDRANGKLIAANQYITKQTWAKGIDEGGRPIPTEITEQARQGREVDVWPVRSAARTGARCRSIPPPA
jgi:alcohol dehydrogenase (cytochrome c)